MSKKVVPDWVFDCNPNNQYAKRQEVNSAAISNDGSLIVAGTYFHDYSDSKHPPRSLSPSDFFMYCFEKNQTGPAKPQPKYTWKQSSGEGVYWVDISGDGKLVAGGGSNFIVAYRTSDGAQVLHHQTKARVNQLVLSSDGTWLAAASDKIYLFRYDEAQYQLTSASEPPNDAYSVSMSSDGKHIAFSDYGPYHDVGSKAQVILFSNDDGTLCNRKAFTEPESYSHCVHMSSGGEYFAAGGEVSGQASPGRIYFFDSSEFVKTGKTAWPPADVSGVVYNVFVDDEGRVAAVCNDGDYMGFVMLFDKTGKEIWKQPQKVCRNPNSTTIAGKYVTVATGHPNTTPTKPSPGYFYLLSAETGETIWQYEVEPPDMCWPMAISSDATGIVAGSDNQRIYYFKP